LIAEVKILSVLFESNVVFIHVGVPLQEQMKIFSGLLDKHGFHEIGYKIVFREGDVQKVIWDVCGEEKIDLLVSGALRKEPLQKQYFGSIARGLARNPKGPVMLVPEPQLPTKPITQIIISVEDDNPVSVLELGLEFSRKIPGSKIFFVKESVLKSAPQSLKQYYNEDEYRDAYNKLINQEKDYISRMMEPFNTEGLQISTRIVFGQSGTGLVEFAREIGADLIIDAHPETKHGILDRLFPHDVEYILLNLPCRLLLFK
jgi:nucleotide-binding universal stress UspA family protein